MTDGRHLPGQHANAPGLGLVLRKIVDLVVAVNERGAFLVVSVAILEEFHHLVRPGMPPTALPVSESLPYLMLQR